MRRLIYATMLVAMVAIAGCSKREVNGNMAAATFAKGYYERLIEGNYEGYVDALNYPDSIPSGYRQQLVLNARLFTEKQKSLHGGWVAVDIAGCDVDSLSSTAQAVLYLCYADSTREKVIVPMVERSGRWYIR